MNDNSPSRYQDVLGSMAGAAQHEDFEKARILLGLLESVERDGGQTQRRLASELGIALGLVNSYLKRCIKKGLVKVSEVPPRRYAYYLTPQGLSEKTRLTIDYLSYSFSLFRRARADYSAVLSAGRARGWKRIVLVGVSDIAEIATICAMNDGMQIVGVVDPKANQARLVGMPVLSQYEQLVCEFDAVVITDLTASNGTYADAVKRFGADRVLAPRFLGLSVHGAPAEVVQ
jgi:DNA-binding MarR family transcriptional regulator